MKSKKIGIVIIVIAIIMVIIGIVLAILINNHKRMEENMATVKTSYINFSVAIINNYEVKNELITKLNSFNKETYSEEHEAYEEILSRYDANVTETNGIVNTLEKKCSTEYSDNSINIMCKSYQDLYETMNNDYVKYLTSYNEKITDYNETSEEDYELHTLVNSEYIDFDKDGTYQSVETNK